jgi:CRP/FNR family transcriptional regulator, nitrogen oxide reductase regulator
MQQLRSLDQMRQASLFEGLDEAALHQVAEAASPVRVARQSYFFHQGEVADRFYLILSGRVRLVQLGPEGHQVTIRYVGPGDSIGVIVALSESDYPLSAEAMTDVEGLAWWAGDIARLMEQHPRLALNGMQMVGRRFHELQLRYRELATERVERRVARALLRLARQTGRKVEQGVLLDLPLSRQDLGEMTGTTLYTVSRIMRSWEEAGLIISSREQVIICSPHGLVAIAEDLTE